MQDVQMGDADAFYVALFGGDHADIHQGLAQALMGGDFYAYLGMSHVYASGSDAIENIIECIIHGPARSRARQRADERDHLIACLQCITDGMLRGYRPGLDDQMKDLIRALLDDCWSLIARLMASVTSPPPPGSTADFGWRRFGRIIEIFIETLEVSGGTDFAQEEIANVEVHLQMLESRR